MDDKTMLLGLAFFASVVALVALGGVTPGPSFQYLPPAGWTKQYEGTS